MNEILMSDMMLRWPLTQLTHSLSLDICISLVLFIYIVRALAFWLIGKTCPHTRHHNYCTRANCVPRRRPISDLSFVYLALVNGARGGGHCWEPVRSLPTPPGFTQFQLSRPGRKT